MNENTPRLWYVSAPTQGKVIIHTTTGIVAKEVAQSDGEFIVRATNSYEPTLDILKRAKKVVAESCGYHDGTRFHTDLLNDIEAAISKAEHADRKDLCPCGCGLERPQISVYGRPS
jgi:hypothetical protein